MSIATQTGDTGTTGLLFGKRVSKADLRIECNGGIDELNAALGMARAHLRGTVGDPTLCEAILGIQQELIILMGNVAVAPEDRELHSQSGQSLVTAEMVDALTLRIHELENDSRLNFHRWATPGDTVASAALEVARTVCRRAERLAVALHESDSSLRMEVICYLNRLSDLLWLWARWMETNEPQNFTEPFTTENP